MAKDSTQFEGQWAELHADVLDSLTDPTRTDLRMADRFVENLQAAAEAIAVARQKPFVKGSTGQLTEHPGYKVAARCDGVALSYARQLKLTKFVRERATDEEPEEAEETDDPILRARDDLAARRRARAA